MASAHGHAGRLGACAAHARYAWALAFAFALGTAAQAPAATAAAPPGTGRELNLVPIVGGDSDVGIGVGEVGSWARLAPEPQLYRWRIENAAFISFKLRDGGLIVPFQDYYLLWSLPGRGPGGRLRLDARAAFTDETTLKFYGFGNAAPEPPAAVPDDDREYRRMHPTLMVALRIRLLRGLHLQLGTTYTHNWLTVRPTSLLATTRDAGPPEARALIRDFDPHGVQLLEIGALYDSRDNEIVPDRGMFHTLLLRVSPRIPGWLPYGYQQLGVSLRFYATPIDPWLTVTWRLVGDVLLGDPPFYELARFEETPAIGGGKAVRGVPAQRYYGKVKLFQNFEVRSQILRFRLRGKDFVLGTALFVDAGRSWVELGHAHPDLDGRGLGLKYGLGGGLRLQQGRTFVVRADVAWSPDARPIGGYFAAGQIF